MTSTAVLMPCDQASIGSSRVAGPYLRTSAAIYPCPRSLADFLRHLFVDVHFCQPFTRQIFLDRPTLAATPD